MGIKIDDISNVIPYLASKFTRDHFKKIQINLFLDDYHAKLIFDLNLDYHLDVLPKHIQINTGLEIN